MKENINIKISLDFAEGLLFLFIAFKLAKIIDWPWVWVLSPLWISVILVIVIWLILFLIQHHSDNKWRRTRY